MSDDSYHRNVEKAIPPDLRGQLTNNKVFARYALADREEVFRRITSVDALGIETFLDLLTFAQMPTGKTDRDAINQTKFMILFIQSRA
jgi:hypothetical protein